MDIKSLALQTIARCLHQAEVTVVCKVCLCPGRCVLMSVCVTAAKREKSCNQQ